MTLAQRSLCEIVISYSNMPLVGGQEKSRAVSVEERWKKKELRTPPHMFIFIYEYYTCVAIITAYVYVKNINIYKDFRKITFKTQ